MQGKVHALDDVLAGETVVVEGFVGVGAVGPAPVDLKDGLAGIINRIGNCAC